MNQTEPCQRHVIETMILKNKHCCVSLVTLINIYLYGQTCRSHNFKFTFIKFEVMIRKQPSFLLRVLDAINSLDKAAEQGCSAKKITEYLCSNYKCDGNVYSTVETQVTIAMFA